MTRPLLSHSIVRLEEMFASARADGKTLRQLVHELQFRHTQRAISLLTKVQGAISSAGTANSPGATHPQAAGPQNPQRDFWGGIAESPIVPVKVTAQPPRRSVLIVHPIFLSRSS